MQDYEGALEEIRSALLVLENDETLAAKEEEINAYYQEYKNRAVSRQWNFRENIQKITGNTL